MTIKTEMEKNKRAMVELIVYCLDCEIYRSGIESIQNEDIPQLDLNQLICSECECASNWTPISGNGDYMIDLDLLVVGAILVDDELFEHKIIEVLTKKCLPSMLKIECDDLLSA